ncbi:hypothetical protein Zm00014a_028788 [Zea mays]|uniref:Uncharacterized protein n=1 Tax=Zea mays TaxID=4577 RepID=A0A3L6FNU1_MAIZE|nr:hypothetical protein Zm00014a_028788 [Zea mays]
MVPSPCSSLLLVPAAAAVWKMQLAAVQADAEVMLPSSSIATLLSLVLFCAVPCSLAPQAHRRSSLCPTVFARTSAPPYVAPSRSSSLLALLSVRPWRSLLARIRRSAPSSPFPWPAWGSCSRVPGRIPCVLSIPQFQLATLSVCLPWPLCAARAAPWCSLRSSAGFSCGALSDRSALSPSRRVMSLMRASSVFAVPLLPDLRRSLTTSRSSLMSWWRPGSLACSRCNDLPYGASRRLTISLGVHSTLQQTYGGR